MARSEVREKFVNFFPNFLYLVFSVVAKNIEGWLNISASYVVYSQIWLNLPTDDHHFFYIFLWMIATLATKQGFLKKNTDVNYQWKIYFWVWALISLETHAHAFYMDLNF